MTPRPAIHEELRTLRKDVHHIASSLVDAQGRLAAISERSEHETAVLLQKVADHERQTAILTRDLHNLRVGDLQARRLAESSSQEREADRRKLRHARKFVKDLLDEKNLTESGSSSGSLRKQDNPAPKVTPPGPPPSSRSSSMGMSSMYAASEPEENQPSIPHEEDNPRASNGARAPPPARSQATNEGSSHEETTTASSEEVRDSGAQTYSTSAEAPGDATNSWRMRHGRPPDSASGLSGPFSVGFLKETLGLTDEQEALLSALGSTPTHNVHVEIVQGQFIFLCDPVFLEAPAQQKTLLVDWGEEAANENILRAIKRAQEANGFLHTFVLPLLKASSEWWYVGAHTWSAVPDMWDIWQGFRRASKESRWRIVTRLCARQGLLAEGQALSDNMRECARRLDEGQVRQLCVQMSGQGQLHKSRQFARDLGHRQIPDGVVGQ
ncbi:hypothetical protein HDZ31DRAFT_48492 [Schizophyllum fasciatum]